MPCLQADVGSLGFFITVGMDSFVFCLGIVMLKNVSAYYDMLVTIY